MEKSKNDREVNSLDGSLAELVQAIPTFSRDGRRPEPSGRSRQLPQSHA